MSFIDKITGIFSKSGLSAYEKRVEEINIFEPEIAALSNEKLKAESLVLHELIIAGKTLDEALTRGFALVREAAKRTLKQRHYDVQLIGGMVLHEGKVAEMLTGEGKTLVATLSTYLNALSEKGVHVITVNDYLAKRDTVWMGQIYHALGLTVSCLLHDSAFQYDPEYVNEKKDAERDETGSYKVVDQYLRPIVRKEAYACDITYGTNHEFGFDYLRDNLALRLGDKVQRGHSYAIVDEVDSILIDEARTPLIIASPDMESSEYYRIFTGIVSRLIKDVDYIVDEKHRVVTPTEEGFSKVEKILNIKNIFDAEHSRLVHFFEESLKAKALFERDKEYLVKNDEVLIVDQFTGRVLHGRRYSGGLHQAIEAKEGVTIRQENRTFAQITLQNYFRLYTKVAGMTGTAQTSAEEFHKVYGLQVVSIPPNRKVTRKDGSDLVYKTEESKYAAIASDVRERFRKGQPVLIGTTSITKNEIVSSYLAKANIPHEVLNAKNNEREGAIIAQAGRKGAVTVATNMAGRGVDIILGGNPPDKQQQEDVLAFGGLHVVGTERHEARRIDNQLRGRSGRQGDSGSSQFYLSLEDDLLRIFNGEKIKSIMERFKLPDDVPIESGLVGKVVNQAQQKVEGMNFDIRKHLLDFDDVLNKQRSALYNRRAELLEAGELNEIRPQLVQVLERYLEHQYLESLPREDEERIKFNEELTKARGKINNLPEKFENEKALMIAQHMVRILDILWIDHLEHLESLRTAVNLRAYGQHEPLVEYRREAHQLFRKMNEQFERLLWNSVFNLIEAPAEQQKKVEEKPRVQVRAAGEKIGRNDPCYCGSGKKYKKCHGR